MSFRIFLRRTAICWLFLSVWPCVASQAQDSSSRSESDSLFGTLFDSLPESSTDSELPAVETNDPLASGFGRETRDPTVPPTLLLDRIPAPVPEPIPSPNLKPNSVRRPIAKRTTVVSLPALPKITLRGIVLSTANRGMAMLSVNDEPINITLLPRDAQQRIPIPEIQFASMKAALDQLAAIGKTASGLASVGTNPRKYEMCLQCSFASEGVIFNVEGFTSDAVLRRAVPHDSLIIVR